MRPGSPATAQAAPDLKTFAGYYSPDGKIVVHSPQINDIGTYRITDDGEFCTRYTTIRNGVETCQTMWQVDQNTIEGHLPNGAVIQATSVPGNPEGFGVRPKV